MFLSRAIPSAIRMISGFGISFRPLCYSVLYSVVPITTVLPLPLPHRSDMVTEVTMPALGNEKAASRAAHSFERTCFARGAPGGAHPGFLRNGTTRVGN